MKCDTAEETGGLDFYGAAPTLPPAKADEETRAFEQLVRKVGEGQARWTRLLELLEKQAT